MTDHYKQFTGTEPTTLGEESKGRPFGVPKEYFVEMFDNDNHSNGVGLAKYKELQGKDGLLRSLKTSEERGISTDDPQIMAERIATYETNAPRPIKIKTLCELIMEQLEDKTLRILIIACIASLSIGIWRDLKEYFKGDDGHVGVSILFAITLCVVVGSWNNYAKEKQFQKLMAAREERDVVVIRDGKEVAISVHALLVGDILRINAGDQLPADCVVLSGMKLSADESSQTGETRDIEKEPLDLNAQSAVNPFLISGTMIKDGKGVAVVVSVGANTRMGRIRGMMEEEDEMTPLQRKLERIANGIGIMGLIVAGITAIAMGGWLLYDCFTDDEGFNDDKLQRAINIVIYAITIIVMAVPEGLPLAVTLSLAYSVAKMKDENNLVRQLDSCETMGGSNNICSDKTGTLTKNVMTVMGIYAEDFTVENEANVPSAHLSPNTKQLLCESVCINSAANVIIDAKTNQTKRLGSATECALLSMAESMGYRYEDYRDNNKEVLAIPFNSKRKRMTTVYKTGDMAKYIVYVKGAPDILLPYCSKIISRGGVEVELDSRGRLELDTKVLKRNAQTGYRSLLLAYKSISSYGFDPKSYKTEESYEELEKDLTIIAIIGIEDPLRDGVPRAVQMCQRAGITVRMVTGDNLDYAKSIAIQSGIITREEMDPDNIEYREYGCMLGIDFYKAVGGVVKVPDPDDPEKTKDKVGNPEMFARIARDLRVLARSQPEHKYLLVTGLKEDENNVVAVTGDGTNDAPALKKADIGFAMGIAGTEIAKEASKIILLDDNFGSIITALKWGRNIFLSIRKFLQFQLTINVVALTIAMISGLAHFKEPPINAIQMLWVNLIMDTFAALALATEPPSSSLLLERPYGKNESILTRSMWRNIICVSIYEVAVLLLVLFFKPDFILFDGPDEGHDDHAKLLNTMIFHTFVMMQVFNEIVCRRIKSNEFLIVDKFFNNWRFITILVVTILVQVGLVQSGAKGINTFPLTWIQHLVCLLLGVNVITWALFCKAIIPESIFAFVKLDEREMSDKEIMKGNVSFLRKPRKMRKGEKEAIRMSGLKSFSYQTKGFDERQVQLVNKTFSKGLVKSLLRKR